MTNKTATEPTSLYETKFKRDFLYAFEWLNLFTPDMTIKEVKEMLLREPERVSTLLYLAGCLPLRKVEKC